MTLKGLKFDGEDMDKLDLEIMSHINPEDLLLSDVEVMETAFDIVNNASVGEGSLSKEYMDILQLNNLRVYSTVVALLENPHKRYWKQ